MFKQLDNFLSTNQGVSIEILFISFVAVAVILVCSIFLLFKKMGDDERSDFLFYKTGSISFLINSGLNSILIIFPLQNWQFFLLINLVITLLVSLTFTIIKYRQFLR